MRSHLALGLALLLFQASHAAPSRWSKTPDLLLLNTLCLWLKRWRI